MHLQCTNYRLNFRSGQEPEPKRERSNKIFILNHIWIIVFAFVRVFIVNDFFLLSQHFLRIALPLASCWLASVSFRFDTNGAESTHSTLQTQDWNVCFFHHFNSAAAAAVAAVVVVVAVVDFLCLSLLFDNKKKKKKNKKDSHLVKQNKYPQNTFISIYGTGVRAMYETTDIAKVIYCFENS